jgi:hypothetical protein
MSEQNQALVFFKEIAIVVIGVLLALFINNWNEGIKQRKIIEKTMHAIEEEIRYTVSELEEMVEKHELTIDTFQVYLDDEDESINEVIYNLGGFQIPEIKNIGLRYFITNNATLVEYDIISDLSEIEFVSRGFHLKVNKLVDFGYDFMDSNSKADKVKFTKMLADVIESEESLLELYEDFLENYKVKLQ